MLYRRLVYDVVKIIVLLPGIDRGPVFDRGRGRGSPNLTGAGAGDFLTDNFKTTKIVINEIMAIFFQNSSNFIRQINFHFYQPLLNLP